MQSRLFCVAALLVAVALGVRLETVFTVNMPYPQTTWSGSGSLAPTTYLHNDGVYVVAQGQDTIEAVNLTTQSNMWVSGNISSSETFDYMAPTNKVVLVQFQGFIRALSGVDGSKMWKLPEYSLGYFYTEGPVGWILGFGAPAYTMGSTVYTLVTLPTGFTAVQGFDIATGALGTTEYATSLQIFGTTIFINKYNVSVQSGAMYPTTFEARDLNTGATLWKIPAVQGIQAGIIPAVKTVSDKYVLLSNVTASGDETAVVVDRATGNIVQTLAAFNGLTLASYYSPPVFIGDKVLALVGEEYLRYVLVDLTTGYIVWTRTYAEVGSGAFSGGAFASISPSLVLSFMSLGSNTPSINVPQVPSLPSPSVIDLGSGVVQVGNLQGFTLWDSATGDLLGRNEQLPQGSSSSAVLKWNGMLILSTGSTITGVQIVQ